MALKSVHSPHHKRHVKFGRKRPDPKAKRLHLRDYLTGTPLPAPPAEANFLTEASAASSTNIYMNADLGCCVISAGWHQLGIWTGLAGDLVVASDDQIVADYGFIGGYVPGDPSTDNGCDEITALNWWTSNGFDEVTDSDLAGWVMVDATNQNLLKQGINLTEGGILTLELPDAWTNPMPSAPGFVWDVAGAPDPDQGHCVEICGYNAQGVMINTWGLVNPATGQGGLMTWAAVAKYCVDSAGGGAYLAISQEMLDKGQTTAPDGLDWDQLVADFDTLGGTVPVPAPPTPAPPTPGPTPVPTPTPAPVPPVPPPVPPPAPPGMLTLGFNPTAKSLVLPAGYNAKPSTTPNSQQIVVHPKLATVEVPKGWSWTS